MEEHGLRVADVNPCIRWTRCHRAAVIPEVHPIQLGTVAIEPALPKACGGGDSATSNGGVDDRALAGVVGEVHVGQHVQDGHGLFAHTQRQKGSNARFVRGASTLELPLDAVVELDGVL
jgi:hypothetical protein